jgi:hypothetical protein
MISFDMRKLGLTLVIPTRNEAENVPVLVGELRKICGEWVHLSYFGTRNRQAGAPGGVAYRADIFVERRSQR